MWEEIQHQQSFSQFNEEDREELIQLAKALVRDRTMLVKLHVRTGDDIDQLVAYWGRGRRDVRRRGGDHPRHPSALDRFR